MRVFPMRVSPFFSLHSVPRPIFPPHSIQTRRRNPAHGKRILPCPGGRVTGPDWRVDAAAAWRRRAQTLPLVDWGGADSGNGGAKTSLTAKRLLRRLFVPP